MQYAKRQSRSRQEALRVVNVLPMSPGRTFGEWWAWVDLNHQPRPYQLSKGRLLGIATVCYRVEFPDQYGRSACFPSATNYNRV